MKNQRDRVIIDTNIWISFLLKKDFSKFDKIISDKMLVLLFSDELVNEFVAVTQSKKLKKYFELNDVESLLLKIRDRAAFINVFSEVSACRDLKDNFLLSLAVDGNATHLITGDKDLLVLKRFRTTDILTMADYLLNK
jgi:uncharacterized protein